MTTLGNLQTNQSTEGRCKMAVGIIASNTNDDLQPPDFNPAHLIAEIEQEIAECAADPTQAVPATGDALVVGIDTEYVPIPGQHHNQVLSYQAYLNNNGRKFSRVYYPSGPAIAKRLTFATFLGRFLHEAKTGGVINEWPSRVIVCGHFIRADLVGFKDFWELIAPNIDGLGKTLTSFRASKRLAVSDTDGADDSKN